MNVELDYAAAHKRIAELRGKASAHLCVDCGGWAQDWSYDHGDPNELADNGMRYSTDIYHYSPRCKGCHRKFDASGERPLPGLFSAIVDPGPQPLRPNNDDVPSQAEVDAMTPDQRKTYTNLLRRMAFRQRLKLHKARRRDPLSSNYNTFWLTAADGRPVVTGKLSQIHTWLITSPDERG
ncbi:MAG: hypothetical protein ACRDTS_07520 [Mycobacterium sp.]